MGRDSLGTVYAEDATFFLDRTAAWIVRIAVVYGRGRLAYFYFLAGSRAFSPAEHLTRHWAVYAHDAAEVSMVLWLTFGLARSRRWAILGLGLVFFSWIWTDIRWFDLPNLLGASFVVVYAAMRLFGSLGPRPIRSVGPRRAFRGDRFVAFVNYAFIVVGWVLTVISYVAGWRDAQAMGTIGLLPFLAQRWSALLWYLVITFLAVWVVRALARSERWAMGLLAFLSLSWLPFPISRLDGFYIVNNAFTLVYCLVRLSAWLSPDG